MGRHKDEELEQALRAADPAGRDDLATWAESEAGRRAYARILEQREERPQKAQKAPTGRRTIRPALATVAVLVVVAAVVIGVVLTTGEPEEQIAASSDTTVVGPAATEAVAPVNGVEQVAALAALVRATEAFGLGAGPQAPESSPTDRAAYVERAESLGITLPAERDSLLTPGLVTRGTYALWIWRAFGALLPQVREVELVDLGTLSGDLREAVLTVVGAGILDARPGGRFEADQPLTAEAEQEALTRLEKTLGLPGSTSSLAPKSLQGTKRVSCHRT